MICKFCKSSKIIQLKHIKSRYFKDINYTLYECEKCLCRFFDIKEHYVSIEKLYNIPAEHHRKFSLSFKTTRYWENQKKIVLKLFGNEISSILDVGCKTGDFLILARRILFVILTP